MLHKLTYVFSNIYLCKCCKDHPGEYLWLEKWITSEMHYDILIFVRLVMYVMMVIFLLYFMQFPCRHCICFWAVLLHWSSEWFYSFCWENLSEDDVLTLFTLCIQIVSFYCWLILRNSCSCNVVSVFCNVTMWILFIYPLKDIKDM